MINGVHTIIYSAKAERLRTFFRDVLQYPFADLGHGWQIFALPPTELGIHPCAPGEEHHEIYFMCDDVDATIADLAKKGVAAVGAVETMPWGRQARVQSPDGDTVTIYQPTHATAINLQK